MKTFTEESKIAQVISRSMTGEIQEAESEILSAWLARSAENRALYERLTSGESFRDQALLRAHFNRKEGSRRIASRLRRSTARRITAWTASAAAVMAAGIILFNIFDPNGNAPSIATLETQPAGVHKAILSVGDVRVELTAQDEEVEWEKYVEQPDAKPGVMQTLMVDVPRGGEYKLRLPDGTQVWLNSESSIEYPVEFTGDSRTVRVVGEVFFDVERDETKPFFVEFADATVRVLGTSFNITAYADDPAATATLVTGSVTVDRNGAQAELVPGKQAVLAAGSTGIVVTDADVLESTSWITGTFMFENMQLRDICMRLSRWYDVPFVFEGRTGDEKFTGGTWKYLPLGEFLAGIEKVTDIRFRYENDRVVVSKM